MNIIEDVREIEEFRNKTFTGFKVSDVKKTLINSLLNNNIEQISYWICELLCAGHFIDLWEVVVMYMAKYIYTGNPRLPLYIELRFKKFRDIINNGYLGNELKLRNNKIIRLLYFEMMFVLSYSNRKHEMKRIKIDKDDFNMDVLRQRFKADTLEYVNKVFKKEDSKELFIAMNEMIYHLEKTERIMSVCYWIEWVLNFELQCKNKKCLCSERDYPVDEKYKRDPVWLIWDALKQKNINKSLLSSLITLFCIKYTAATKRKRVFIIYFAVYLVLEKVDLKTPIINDKDKIDCIIKDSDKMFKHIKKSEVTKKTGRFESTGKYNEGYLEDSLKKLDILNNHFY